VLGAETAKRVGLIDEIGGYQTAERIALELAGIKKDEAVVHEAPAPISLAEKLGIFPGASATMNRLEELSASAEINAPMFLMKL